MSHFRQEADVSLGPELYIWPGRLSFAYIWHKEAIVRTHGFRELTVNVDFPGHSTDEVPGFASWDDPAAHINASTKRSAHPRGEWAPIAKVRYPLAFVAPGLIPGCRLPAGRCG